MKLYQDVGKKIKTLCVVIVIIGMSLCVVCGLVIMAFLGRVHGIFIIVGFLVTLAGAFICWISGMLLYAFGEITDRIVSIDEKVISVTNAANQANKARKNDIKVTSKKATIDRFGLPDYPGRTNEKTMEEETFWTCACCGKENIDDVDVCWNCGVSRGKTEREPTPEPEQEPEEDQTKNLWCCKHCGMWNHISSDTCSQCGNKKE